MDDQFANVLGVRHRVQLYVCGGSIRKPLIGELGDVGDLAERDRGALPRYLDIEQIRDLALILHFPAPCDLARKGSLERVGAFLEVEEEEVVDIATHT